MARIQQESDRTIAIVRRRERIEELMGEGLRSSYQLAERLTAEGMTCSYKTVQRDVDAMAAAIGERTMGLRLELIADCRWRQKQARAEWERSKLDRERAKVQTTTGEIGTVEHGIGKTVQEQTSEGRIAEAALLREDRENGAEIAKLAGAYVPVKHELTGPDGGAIPLEVKEIVVRTRAEAAGLLPALSGASRISGRN